MYFNFLPSINYDRKPIGYPFSESDYIVAKNFFRRFKLSDGAYDFSVYYNKVAVTDGDRLEQIAERVYGDPEYDWVIALTNNMIDPLFGLPMTGDELTKHVENLYDNPYDDIHHYEIISDRLQIKRYGQVLIPGGTWVDESFYTGDELFTPQADLPNLTPNDIVLPTLVQYVFTDGSLADRMDNDLFTALSGSSFEAFGTGFGNDGGFVLYPPIKNNKRSGGYLRFRGNANAERFAITAPLDTTTVDKVTLIANYGTDTNGGEWPDQADEVLKLAYRNDPLEAWTEIGTIIERGSIQTIVFDGSPDTDDDGGNGGTGRQSGTYTDVPIYADGTNTLTGAKVTVVIDNLEITSVTVTDRGAGMTDGQAVYVLQSDIGGGTYGDVNGDIFDLPDFNFNIGSVRADNFLRQFGRTDFVPFEFSIDLPVTAKTAATELKLYQPSNTGLTMDQYAIVSLKLVGSVTTQMPLGFEWNRIDDDNYVIDGVEWERVDGVWYKRTRSGFQYWAGDRVEEVDGSDLAFPVNMYQYEQVENEKKREISLLKPQYLDGFVDSFRSAARYQTSSDYISKRLKKTGA